MTAQEKLDAIYEFERARNVEERAARDERTITEAMAVFLEGAKAAAQAGGPAEYVHFFPREGERLLPEISRRLCAEGYRVRERHSLWLVMEFGSTRPDPPPPKSSFRGFFGHTKK